MLVRAKKLLFYGSLFDEGMPFSLQRAEDFDPAVMVMVDEDAPLAPPPADPSAVRSDPLSFEAAMKQEAIDQQAAKEASDKVVVKAVAEAKKTSAREATPEEATPEGGDLTEGEASDVAAFDAMNAPPTTDVATPVASRRRSTASRVGN